MALSALHQGWGRGVSDGSDVDGRSLLYRLDGRSSLSSDRRGGIREEHELQMKKWRLSPPSPWPRAQLAALASPSMGSNSGFQGQR